MPARPSVAASVARPFADVEATALPASEDEWLKFDVIVLGDVDLEAMPAEVARVLERFVGVRGGTLVVVAGRTAMPHALAGTPFVDVLPVTVRAPPPGLDLLPAPEAGFRVKLTPDGRDHVLARLDPSPPRNEEVWDGLPSMRWRHGLVTAKDGATVLAFALPLEQGSAIATSRPHEVPDEATILARARFAREHPLLVIHEVGPGRVLFLGTDETWRLRYRVGDALHHRFWGQVLRWATADKLPGGTAHVRLGTERTRYPLTADVRVRARLTRADFSPVVSDQISVNVFAADTLVLKRRLEPDGRVPGLYAANLGRFVPGTYRVDLDAPPVRSALAEAGVESVSAGFAVEATVPAEQVELAADRGLLDRLAGLSRGMVVEPQNAVELTSALGPGLVSRPETRQWALWDSWVLWFAFGGLAGTEWWLRKRVRLP